LGVPGGLRAVLLGAPGSGKGTQAERIARTLAVPAISTGEMLRQAVAEGSALGARVASVMAAGLLVDDDLMAAVVGERLRRSDAAGGFLLDGYPRTTTQAETLDSLLAHRDGGINAVLLLDVPEDVLVHRAAGRRRADDREDVVRQRLEVYREKTEPLIGHYERRGLLRRVNGDRPVDEVTEAILQLLKEL
jgi:adenylate kinase